MYISINVIIGIYNDLDGQKRDKFLIGKYNYYKMSLSREQNRIRMFYINRLGILQDILGITIPEFCFETSVNNDKLKWLYEQYAHFCKLGQLWARIDKLVDMNLIPNYDHNLSYDELEAYCLSMETLLVMLHSLCMVCNKPLDLALKHDQYTNFLNIYSNSNDIKSIAKYFNMVYETNFNEDDVNLAHESIMGTLHGRD